MGGAGLFFIKERRKGKNDGMELIYLINGMEFIRGRGASGP